MARKQRLQTVQGMSAAAVAAMLPINAAVAPQAKSLNVSDVVDTSNAGADQ